MEDRDGEFPVRPCPGSLGPVLFGMERPPMPHRWGNPPQVTPCTFNYRVLLQVCVNLLLQLLLDVWIDGQEVGSVTEGIGSGLIASQHESDGIADDL